MRVVFAGTPEPAVQSLLAVHASRHEVAAVLTRPDASAGRGKKLRPSEIAIVADELGIPVIKPNRPDDVEDQLRDFAPDCCPVVAYGHLIKEPLLSLPRYGWVNLHFSLLPAWRGAAPVQHAIIAGDDVTGACTFKLTKGMDTGPIYGSVTTTVAHDTTAGEVLDDLSKVGSELLVHTLDSIETGECQPVEQPRDGVSLAPKITSTDARVRWNDPALAIGRRIRGVTPTPGAWTTLRGNRVKLAPVHDVSQEMPSLSPGEIRVIDKAVVVGTGSNPVVLTQVQPAGKKLMAATDWARGARIGADDTADIFDN